jgi:hypothetical protein
MNPPENHDDDPLDRLLREQESYVEDNGFTARVLDALPHRRSLRLRTVLLLCATAMGSVLVASWFGSTDMPALDFAAMMSLDARVLLPWLMELLAVAFLAGGAFAAVQSEG